MTTNHTLSEEEQTIISSALIEEQQLQRQIEAAEKELDVVNLDEVAPEPIKVALIERVQVEEQDEDGKPVTRYRTKTIHHLIETYVPYELYLEMLRINSKFGNGKKFREMTEQQQREMFEEQRKLVLKVWQLTEPEMTDERLKKGLDFTKTTALFKRFFGAKSRQSTANL